MWLRNKKNIAAFCLIFLFISTYSLDSFTQIREYLIKSAFIEKITRFIEWPDEKIKEKEEIVFGIISNNREVINTMQFYFTDQLIQNKKVQVKQISDYRKLNEYDIIFIANDYHNNINSIIEQITNMHILLITEKDGYGERGAHINLILNANKINFEINPDQLNKEGFYVSSKIYAYAEIVKKPNL